jgi:CheY-like chemotaxis protein
MPARILVAEDNPDARELLYIVLTEEGFEVVGVEDGQAALDAAKAARPDLIITDIQMPNLDGIDMIKALRGQPELAEVPVLVISATNSGIIKEALDAGANAAASKPVSLDSLVRLIKSLLTAVGLVFLSHSYCLNKVIASVEDFLHPLV